MWRSLGKNAPYFRQQGYALLDNTSASVKCIASVVILSYCFSYFDGAVRILAVTPGYLMPPSFWIWTAFTFCFLEVHMWEIVVDIVTVGLCAKLIEPLWGQLEQFVFFAVVNLGVAFCTTSFYFVLYACTLDPHVLYGVHIHGLSGYIAAVSVAVKQIMPDLVIVRTPLVKLTNRNVPLIVWLLSLVLWLIGVLDGTYPIMFVSGLLVSWVYLRFYQRHSNGTRGDLADSFTFASFFPNVLQPPIVLLSNAIHNTLVKLGVCRKVVRKFDLSNPSGVTVSVHSSNSNSLDQHDIERRRHIALKALSDRLFKTSQDVQPLLPFTNTHSQQHSCSPEKSISIEKTNSNSEQIVIDVIQSNTEQSGQDTSTSTI